MIILMETANDGDQTLPTTFGTWTPFGTPVGVGSGTTGTKLWGWYKIRAGEGTTVSITSTTAANHRAAIMMGCKGIDTTTPIYNISSYITDGGSVSTVPCPAVTITSASDLGFWATSTGTDTATGQGNAPTATNATATLCANFSTASGSGGGVVAAYGVPSSAGVSASVTHNLKTATQYSAVSFVIKAAGGAPVAPTITSSSTVSNPENTPLAHNLTADQTVSWSILTDPTSFDYSSFELSGSTLRWLSNGTKDYETPSSFFGTNTYTVKVRATNTTTSATADQTITVNVTDVAEGGGGPTPRPRRFSGGFW